MGRNLSHLPGICCGVLILLSCLAPVCAEEPGGTESETAGLRLELGAAKTRLYLHEPVTVSVTLSTDSRTVRNIGYPRLAGTGFTLVAFGLPRQQDAVLDGHEGTSYEFRATLTPTRAGSLELGPAELGCELPAPADGAAAFFGATKLRPVTLRSEPLALSVLPLPVAGRPAGFSGAVGRFTVSRTARPVTAAVGEPVTVRTVISGTGNLKVFRCPTVGGEQWHSYPVRRGLNDGTLVCEQLVIPETAAVREVPPATISFFDPEKGRYRSASSGPVPLQVQAPAPAPAAVAAPAAAVVPAALPPAAPTPSSAVPLWTLAGLAVAAGMGGTLLVCRRGQDRSPVAAPPDPLPALRARVAEAEAACLAGDAEAFYTAAFRVVQALTGVRLELAPAGITAPLPAGMLPEPELARARTLLACCDRVRYGRHQNDPADMKADLTLLHELLAAAFPHL